MFPTHAQEYAISKIIEEYNDNNRIVNFKAPTGSGKTFMIANVISRILKQNQLNNQNTIFICATVSDGALPRQMENNFNQYQNHLDIQQGCKFQTFYYGSPSSNDKYTPKDAITFIPTIANSVYIFGKQSFGKDRIFNQEKTIEKFVNDIKNKDFKLIYIRDEAHLGGDIKFRSISGEENFEQLMDKNADFIIKLTATPKESDNLVEIPKELLEKPSDNKYLIKLNREIDSGIKDQNIDEIDDRSYFKIAVDHFKNHIQPAYKSDDKLKNIRPCMLIQVDSETKANKEQWDKTIEFVKKYLTENNLSWVLWLSDNKEYSHRESSCEHSLSQDDSIYDCVIFKVALAKGWNIPRACMLIQLRNLSSIALNTQTIGRIMRNPIKDLSRSELALTYWIYSRVEETRKDFIKFVLNPNYIGKKIFPQILINKDTESFFDKKNFLLEIKKYLKDNSKKIIQVYKENFINKSKFSMEVATINKTKRVEYIDNSIKLYFHVISLKFKNQKVFDLIKEIVVQSHRSISNTLSFTHYSFILLYSQFGFVSKINDLFNSYSKEQILNFESSDKPYTLNKEKMPESFYETEDNKIKIEYYGDDFTQMYLLYGPASNKIKDIYLDSKSEKIFFDEIKSIVFNQILDTKKDLREREIEVWGKNPGKISNNPMFIEYLNNVDEKQKSYPDVVIKIKDKFLILEIKSFDDIDEDKTKLIQEGMSKGIQLLNDNTLFYGIVKVDTRTKEINVDEIYCSKSNEVHEFKYNTLKSLIERIYSL